MKDINKILDSIEVLIKTMDVPKMRRVMNESNVRWLSRNLLIRNSNHKHINEVMILIKYYLKNLYKN
jgi:hypothetical protein